MKYLKHILAAIGIIAIIAVIVLWQVNQSKKIKYGVQAGIYIDTLIKLGLLPTGKQIDSAVQKKIDESKLTNEVKTSAK